MSVSVAAIPKNRCRTTVPERMWRKRERYCPLPGTMSVCLGRNQAGIWGSVERCDVPPSSRCGEHSKVDLIRAESSHTWSHVLSGRSPSACLPGTTLGISMASWTPDPTFYPSPRPAAGAPPEKLAYVASFDPARRRNDEMAVVDLDSGSLTYGQILRRVEMSGAGDELHHFGWNACSSCLCPNMPHPHVERRYLIVPGIRSSRIHILDAKPDPKNPEIVRVLQPAEIADRSGYTRPHTVHCGPDGIYISALGNAEGKAPGGILLMDHETFDVLGRWEVDRGPQQLAYDMWWHLGHDTVITSEWGTPDTFENGLVPELLLGGKYGHKLHFWDLHRRKHLQEIDLGTQHQLIFELRPAHDPTKAYGFVNCVLSLENLSSSIWTWYREGERWQAKKVIEIPAEPADPDQLPPTLKDFKACPPFVTDIDLSVDDKYLYVSCWGTGDFHQYDVSDPLDPKLTIG